VDGDCACGVSATEFEALRDQVRALSATVNEYGSLEATVNDVISVQTEMATCMSDAVSMWDDGSVPAGPETVATTESADEETDDYSDISTFITDGLDDSINNRCGLGQNERSFRLDFTTVENCIIRCMDDQSCNYATHNNAVDDGISKYCIGCIRLSSWTNGWHVYESFESENGFLGARRSLAAIEKENAYLKKLIEDLRDELRR